MVRRTIVLGTMVLLLLTGAVLVVTGLRFGEDSLPALFFFAPILIVAGAFGGYLGASAFRERLASYTITLEGQGITRSQRGLPDLTIDQDEIADLLEAPGGLIVRSEVPYREIHIPRALEGYDELRTLLNQIKEVQPFPQRPWYFSSPIQIGGVFLMLAGFLTTVASDNPYVLVPCSVFVIIAFLSCLWLIQRNPQIDTRTKALSWMILLPLFSVVLRLAIILGLFPST
jgi:hypothetical protein